VFSGKHQNADNWIVNYISTNKDEMVQLITDDLRLRERIKVKRVKFSDCMIWFNDLNSNHKISKRKKNEFGSQEYWEDYFCE
jgi:hypothetical protein